MQLPYIFSLIRTFFVRFRFILLGGVVFGLIAFFLFRIAGGIIPGGKTERIGVVGEYLPNNIPDSVGFLISGGLTRTAEDGEAISDLAQNWENQDQGKTWVFHLKKDLKWQDGTVIKASDIKYNFDDVNVSYPDANTIVFKLKLPFSPFPTVVARPVFKTGLLGNGEWKVTSISLKENFVEKLTLNDGKGNSKLFRFYPSEEDVKLAFELGEIDSIPNLFNPKPLDGWGLLNVGKQIDNNHVVVLFYNTASQFLGDKNVREALTYAIDKNFMEGQRAYSPIAQTSWAYNPQVRTYDQDIDKAKDLIKNSKLEDNAKKNIKIRLFAPANLINAAEKIVKNWDQIGVKGTVQIVSFVPNDYDAYLAIYTIPDDPDQYTTWHSTETDTNLSNYKNIRIDKLLEDGRLELNQENRKKIYLDFQRFLVEDAPAAFLYNPYIYSIMR